MPHPIEHFLGLTEEGWELRSDGLEWQLDFDWYVNEERPTEKPFRQGRTNVTNEWWGGTFADGSLAVSMRDYTDFGQGFCIFVHGDDDHYMVRKGLTYDAALALLRRIPTVIDTETLTALGFVLG